MPKKRNKRVKAANRAKEVSKAKITRSLRADQEIHIDCPTFQYPDAPIPFKGTIEFFNECTDTRHLEFFDISNQHRPIMFIQLEPGDSVTLVGGPDSDCHRPHECSYNVRIPGRERDQQIENGSNKIIINS